MCVYISRSRIINVDRATITDIVIDSTRNRCRDVESRRNRNRNRTCKIKRIPSIGRHLYISSTTHTMCAAVDLCATNRTANRAR